MLIEGAVAVVTGGADGIGLGAAQKFQQLGAQVVVGDVSETKLERAASMGLHALACDVRNDDDLAALAELAYRLGEVDLVMANAGVSIGGRFERVPTSEWQRLFEVNVIGVVRTINAFLPAMLERGRGHIVVTGSSAGLFRGDGMNAPYAASKYALRGMAQALAVYCGHTGISVHYLAPRLTDTAFPLSTTAWGRKGSRITSDRDIGADFDTVDQVVEALIHGIENEEFLISLTADTADKLVAMARDPLAEP